MLRELHPALIHFPIALLLTGIALTVLYLRRPDPILERSAYGALVLGWWGTAAGICTGLVAAAVQWPFEATTLNWINWHALTSFALLFSTGQAVLLRKRHPDLLLQSGRRRYLVLLALSALLVVVSGWLGGHLVYELKVGPSS
ncbi:MAG: hypothetical protein H0X37_22710 [Herpetosiphonaceae bacterium]|nr:hypothetical protein [Herpetosiphonaceae bacterium]